MASVTGARLRDGTTGDVGRHGPGGDVRLYWPAAEHRLPGRPDRARSGGADPDRRRRCGPSCAGLCAAGAVRAGWLGRAVISAGEGAIAAHCRRSLSERCSLARDRGATHGERIDGSRSRADTRRRSRASAWRRGRKASTARSSIWSIACSTIPKPSWTRCGDWFAQHLPDGRDAHHQAARELGRRCRHARQDRGRGQRRHPRRRLVKHL